jgi:4-amino-4-deoxy-L-arabinose transferase-like glycosyltransferase
MDKRRPGCDHREVTKRSLPDPAIALLFFLATLASRIPILSRSILDWDESLYFLMAQQWRHGHLPYTTIWDNKPIGIYAIFAVFQALFGGQQIFAIRIATVVFVAALAFTVFKITKEITGDRRAAWIAGGALILCSLSDDGLSANTELFMATFTALAVLAALTTRQGLLVGLLLGAAFMVKYVSVFEAPAVFFLFLSRQPRPRAGAAVLLGAALPLAAAILLYAAAGRLGLWWDDSIASNFRRVSAPISPSTLHYALGVQLWRWGPMLLSAAALLPWALFRHRGLDIFLCAWLLGGVVGVISGKFFYDHYFLQLLPVLCILLGTWSARLPRHAALQAALVLAALALPVWAAHIALRNAKGPDAPAQAAAALRSQPHASFYVFDTQPIIYGLTGETPPTSYVLPSELIGNFLPEVAGIDAPAEVARILATNPEYILRRSDPSTNPAIINPRVYLLVDQAIASHYQLWRRYQDIEIFKRK